MTLLEYKMQSVPKHLNGTIEGRCGIGRKRGGKSPGGRAMKKTAFIPYFFIPEPHKSKASRNLWIPPIPTLDNMGQVHFLVLRIHIRLFLFISSSRMRAACMGNETMRRGSDLGAIGIVGAFPSKEDEEADLAVGPTKPIADLLTCHVTTRLLILFMSATTYNFLF